MEEQFLIQGLMNRNKVVFDFIFHYYYSGLCAYSERFTNSRDAAEDIVQELFLNLWIKNQQLRINSSLKNYLFISVKNRSIDYLKKEHRKAYKINRLAVDIESDENLSTFWFAEAELNEIVEKSLEKLPPRCREIFEMSRMDGMNNQDIATKLNLSKRTVELQISNALRHLRTEMATYLPLQILMLLIR